MKRLRYHIKHNILILFVVCALTSSVLHGCKKDDIEFIEPDVTLISPNIALSFNVYDTIYIKAQVNHNIKIESATISITDKNLKSLVGGPVINPNATQFEIDTYIVINNKYIEQSDNYLLIEIEDEKEKYNFWYNLKINPLEKELQNLLVVTGSSSNQMQYGDKKAEQTNGTSGNNKLLNVNLNGSYRIISDWNSEYLGGYVDSHFGMFYSSGSINSGITGFNLIEEELSWSIPAQSGGAIPYFTAFDAIEGKVSVGIYDGTIRCYDQNGLILMKTDKLAGGKFTAVKNFDKWVVGVFKPFDGSNSKLYVFNNPAGNQFDMVNLPGEIVDLILLDAKTLLVVIVEKGINEAYTYTFSEKQFNYLHEITNDVLYQSAGDGDNIFFISDSTIKWYRPDIGSTVDYLNIADANSLAFDPISKVLFVGKYNSLFLYPLPSTTPSMTIELPGEIKDINLLYNK